MSELATRYATLLWELAPQRELVEESAKQIQEPIALWEALCHPAIRASEKCAVLSRLPWFETQPKLLHFYQLLAQKGRISLLPEILSAYAVEERKANHVGYCELRCVRIPDATQQAKLAETLCRLHGHQSVSFHIVQEAELLGGFVLHIDGMTYDNSVRGRLNRLTQRMQER